MGQHDCGVSDLRQHAPRIAVHYEAEPTISTDRQAPAWSLEGIVGEPISFDAIDEHSPQFTVLASPPGKPAKIDGGTVTPSAPGELEILCVAGHRSSTCTIKVFPKAALDRLAIVSLGIDKGRTRTMKQRRLVLRSLAAHGNLSREAMEAMTDAQPLPCVDLRMFGG